MPIHTHLSKKTDFLATNSMANEFIFRFVCNIRCITPVELIFAKLEIVWHVCAKTCSINCHKDQLELSAFVRWQNVRPYFKLLINFNSYSKSVLDSKFCVWLFLVNLLQVFLCACKYLGNCDPNSRRNSYRYSSENF